MGCRLSLQGAQALKNEVDSASSERPSNETDFISKCGSIGVDEVCPLLKELQRQKSKTLSRTLFQGFMKAYTSNSVDVAEKIVDEDSKLNGTSTLFRELVKKKPAIAYKLLNKCYIVEDDSITFNFKYIEDTSYQSDDSPRESPEDSSHNAEELSVSVEQHTSDEREDSSRGLTEDPSQNAEGNLSVSVSQCLGTCVDTKPHILELMESCDSDDSDVLLHPVVQCLLRWKWSHYIDFFYGINLAIFMVYLSFLTTFALSVPNPQISLCSNETVTECEHSLPRRGFLGFAAFVTIGFSIFRLLLECGQLINMKKLIQRLGCCNEGDNGRVIKLEYFRSLSNYLEIPMYLLSIAFVATTNSCFCPSPLQWQAGTVAVFFAWINFILFLNKWPDLGIYIGIVWKITIRFLSVSVIATLLLISFTFAFYMAFYEPDLPDTPFESPLVTFVTMISFAISTPDISVFRLANDDTREDTIPYPVLSFIIWIIFGVIMSVLFLNFLVGLAVDDVAALRKQAKKDRTRIMINLFKSVEEMIKIFNFLALKWNWFKKCLRKRFKHTYSVKCDSRHTKVAFLWGDGIKDIIQHCRKEKEKSNPDNIEDLLQKIQNYLQSLNTQ